MSFALPPLNPTARSDWTLTTIRDRRLARKSRPNPLELRRRRFLHGRIVIEAGVALEEHRLLRGAHGLDRGAHAHDGHGLIGFAGDDEHRAADGRVALRIALEKTVNPGIGLPIRAQQGAA